MTTPVCDAILIGGGHNGLVCGVAGVKSCNDTSRTTSHPCLDAASNHCFEQIKDPSGNVKRQLRGQLAKVLNAANAPVDTSAGLSATGIADGYDGNHHRWVNTSSFMPQPTRSGNCR